MSLDLLTSLLTSYSVEIACINPHPLYSPIITDQSIPDAFLRPRTFTDMSSSAETPLSIDSLSSIDTEDRDGTRIESPLKSCRLHPPPSRHHRRYQSSFSASSTSEFDSATGESDWRESQGGGHGEEGDWATRSSCSFSNTMNSRIQVDNLPLSISPLSLQDKTYRRPFTPGLSSHGGPHSVPHLRRQQEHQLWDPSSVDIEISFAEREAREVEWEQDQWGRVQEAEGDEDDPSSSSFDLFRFPHSDLSSLLSMAGEGLTSYEEV
jgi:hypothetical protein